MPVVKNEVKSEYELLNIIGKSLDVLRDGHIWVVTDFKVYTNNEFMLKPDGQSYYAEDFVPGLVQKLYLNTSTDKDDYKGDKSFVTRNGAIYGTIEREGKKFAYIYYDDFSVELQPIDYQYLDSVIQEADAVLFDIRNNPGGSAGLGLEMAGRFMKEKTLVGYSTYKSGKGYDDFEEPAAFYCKPSEEYNWADKQTALLTNRGVYSTANLFTAVMKHAPNVIQVGQTSGGGGGLPMTHYLPNGWCVVFASNIILDSEMNHVEPGIAPDYEAEIGDYLTTGEDGIIEKAIEELLKRI
jgi:C-terminal processing protease CtpA/Prc